MISELELYCILKLDAISNAIFCLASASTFSSLLLLIAGILSEADKGSNVSWHFITKKERAIQRAKNLRLSKQIKNCFRASGLALCFSLFFWAVYTLMPTTKQAAAIMVVPKIATNENIETLTDEAKSIYGLAKEYFSKSVREETF